MTEYELLVKILEEVLDHAGSYKINDLVAIWNAISGEKWEYCNDEIVPTPEDNYYDD